jgi:HEPN domain-containing protein
MSAPSPDDLTEAERWMREAEEELAVAVRIASEPDLPGRVACFHAHLAAEKAIKSLQIRRAVPVRKIHNLVQLVRELPAADSGTFAGADLNLLNPPTIDGRYPADQEAVSGAQTQLVLEAANRLLAAVRALHETGNA